MKRFHFTLESVLRYKQQRERLARVLHHQAQAALSAWQAQMQALHGQLEQTAAAMQGRLGKPLDLGAWLAAYQHAEHLGRALREAETQAQQAAQRLLQASEHRRQTAVEVEILDGLRERQRQRHHEEAGRAEQIRLDEIGLRPWSYPDAEAAY